MAVAGSAGAGLMLDTTALAADVAAIAALASAPIVPPAGFPSTIVGTPPAISKAALADGMVTTLLWDDFNDPTTVDLAHTFDRNKVWWQWKTQDTSGISIANSCLNIAVSGSTTGNDVTTSTVLQDPVTKFWSKGSQGFAVKGSHHARFRLKTNKFAIPGTSWTAGWTMPLEYQLIQNKMELLQQCLPAQWCELDGIEVMAQTEGNVAVPMPCMFLNAHFFTGKVVSSPPGAVYWNCDWSNQSGTQNNWGGPAGKSIPQGFDLDNFNDYAYTLICNPDGSGQLKRYINDTLIPECGISWTADTKVLNLLNKQTYFFILGGHPSSFDHVWVGAKDASGVAVY
jgi:hypothetical protein